MKYTKVKSIEDRSFCYDISIREKAAFSGSYSYTNIFTNPEFLKKERNRIIWGHDNSGLSKVDIGLTVLFPRELIVRYREKLSRCARNKRPISNIAEERSKEDESNEGFPGYN